MLSHPFFGRQHQPFLSENIKDLNLFLLFSQTNIKWWIFKDKVQTAFKLFLNIFTLIDIIKFIAA